MSPNHKFTPVKTSKSVHPDPFFQSHTISPPNKYTFLEALMCPHSQSLFLGNHTVFPTNKSISLGDHCAPYSQSNFPWSLTIIPTKRSIFYGAQICPYQQVNFLGPYRYTFLVSMCTLPRNETYFNWSLDVFANHTSAFFEASLLLLLKDQFFIRSNLSPNHKSTFCKPYILVSTHTHPLSSIELYCNLIDRSSCCLCSPLLDSQNNFKPLIQIGCRNKDFYVSNILKVSVCS